ncbi:MAG: PIN domain-containing protein [Nitrospirae bacterium]|nr:PIN domain-containing protein [Nitrospirota bacterium]
MQKADNAESYVLDTSAIFALWNDEQGADTVEHILHSGAPVLVSFMTIMEGRYRLWKNAGKEASDEFSKYISLLPVRRIDMTNAIFENAIEIKAANSLSVCDSWIIATAIATKSILVHKDPEFEQVKKIVQLKTLPYKSSRTK